MSLLTSAATQRREKTGRLRQRFLIFRLRIGIGHDASVNVEMREAVFANRRANGG